MKEREKAIIQGIVTLTPREYGIVKALADGKSVKEVAFDCGVKHHAMMAAIRYMRVRLGYRTTVQMICDLVKNTETIDRQDGVRKSLEP